MKVSNLTNCDDEPIHIPGHIQSHGFLIALSKDFVIRYVSENIGQFLPVSQKDVLGRAIKDFTDIVLDPGTTLNFESILAVLANQQQGYANNVFQQKIGDKRFNIVLNQSDELYLLDFEPAESDLRLDLQQVVGRSLSEMLADKDLDNLLRNAAEQVKKIIGYNRVMIYKFHEDGHGEVVAEAKDDDRDDWIGLHYPASDIPQQARELYKTNLVRLIADVNDIPSPLLAAQRTGDTPLNLTNSVLRAVSPLHIQYLKNMGVASSFSVSIIDQNELWGLIACHNYTPRFINFQQRESAKLVGQVLSSAISFREQDEYQQSIAKHRRAIESITRYLLRNVPVQEAVLNEESSLKDVVDSSGAVFYFENYIHAKGNVPDSEFVESLIKFLDIRTSESGYYTTTKLAHEFPEAKIYKDIASGVMACRLGKELSEYLIWFRPEIVQTVRWAGNPEKQVDVDRTGFSHISPRNSFEEWRQKVQMTSALWKKDELDAAFSLRDEVNYAISRKATELRVNNERLRQAYAELDTFSYTISHDLKNPLSTVKSYAQLIMRETLSFDKTRMLAQKVEAAANKMQFMIDEVLQYSKAGKSAVQLKQINMKNLMEEIKADLIVSATNEELVIDLMDLPDIAGDELMVMQVFTNLLGNGVKYSALAAEPRVTVSGVEDDTEVTYEVSDNGVGIAPAEHEAVFELFTRANSSKGFEGTGVGLAIVKRIIQRHNGRIWLKSEPGRGSSFFVSFPKRTGSA